MKTSNKKKCKCCLKLKKIKDFPKKKQCKDGHESKCKSCVYKKRMLNKLNVYKQNKISYQKHRLKRIENQKVYLLNNPIQKIKKINLSIKKEKIERDLLSDRYLKRLLKAGKILSNLTTHCFLFLPELLKLKKIQLTLKRKIYEKPEV